MDEKILARPVRLGMMNVFPLTLEFLMTEAALPSAVDFFAEYNPVKNTIRPDSGCIEICEDDGSSHCVGFETFGPELDYVRNMHESDPKRVWTMIDGEEGVLIVAGFRLVNRIAYLITEKPWVTGTEVFDDESEFGDDDLAN